MLDTYKETQKIIYQTIVNSVKKNKLSHAYLIELNDEDGIEFAKTISKFLLCKNHYTNSSNCEKCNICHQVDTENYIELEIIRPDGNYIKKAQIQDIQEKFLKESLVDNYKIYIISEVEKLNEEAANSLLKFLEEPNKGIIAILLTNNVYQVYNTIKSRCQILKMINNKIEKIDLNKYLFNDIENYNEIVQLFIDYIIFLDKNKFETIIFKNKQIIQDIKKINNNETFFKFAILFYKDILSYKLNKKIKYFLEYENVIIELEKINSEIEITKKINILIDLSTKIKYNLNQNLLFDKLVISFAEV